MVRKVIRLSHLQKTVLIIAAYDARGEYCYETMRQAFGYSKISISRSARRLERRGFIKRETHAARITVFGESVIHGALLRHSASWWTASQATILYIQVAAAKRDKDTFAARRKARITAQIIERYTQHK